MYAKVQDGKLIFPEPNKNNNILNYCGDNAMLESDGFIKMTDEQESAFNKGSDYYDISSGVFVIVSDAEVNARTAEREKLAMLSDLRNQIDAIDKKRVRAMVEPSVKNIATGQTWLEYYTQQILDLRTRIAAL